MSTGHRIDIRPKSRMELLEVLGQGDTPRLMVQSFELDHGHDVAYAGGVSVDRKVVYIDRTLYREIMSGAVRVRGLAPRQVIERIVDHEHCEKAVDDGDNAVDVYQPAHAFALRREHEGVEDIVGDGGASRYEADLRPALQECRKRFLKLDRKANPPRDLWCGPYLDHATGVDRKILAIMAAKGVKDASKLSKYAVHYGEGPEECKRCSMFIDPERTSSQLHECTLVSGLVRADRWCERWVERK
jgi:hypothetical protein